jgi:hypothetical protein
MWKETITAYYKVQSRNLSGIQTIKKTSVEHEAGVLIIKPQLDTVGGGGQKEMQVVTGRTCTCMVKRFASYMTDTVNFFSMANSNAIIQDPCFFKTPYHEILVLLYTVSNSCVYF